MRIRLLLVTIAVTALSLVAASPASAAVSHDEAVGALLTAKEVGKNWHKVAVSDGMSGILHGCASAQYTSKGVDAKAARALQFRQQESWITERLKSFDTTKLAGREVNKWVARYSECDSFQHDGQTFTISKAKVGDFADKTAAFKIKGIVTRRRRRRDAGHRDPRRSQVGPPRGQRNAGRRGRPDRRPGGRNAQVHHSGRQGRRRKDRQQAGSLTRHRRSRRPGRSCGRAVDDFGRFAPVGGGRALSLTVSDASPTAWHQDRPPGEGSRAVSGGKVAQVLGR